MRNVLLAAAAVSMFAVPAMAQSIQSPSYYGTLGYSQLDHSDGDLGAVTGRLGAKLTPNFGVEAEASFGVRDDDFSIGGVDGKIKLSPKKLHVTAQLGFMLSMLKGPIEAEIKRVLSEKFD